MDVEDAYDIIERIIVNGFLTAELRCGGSYIVLKNMTDREAGMLDLFRDGKSRIEDMSCKMALCTLSIDGTNYMSLRSEAIPVLMDFWSGAPVSLMTAAIDSVKGINIRYYEVLDYLEGFCYSDKSRYLWRVYKEGGLYTVPGVMAAGMNAVQENWVFVNRELDGEADYDREFHLALMVASSLNSAGAKVISKNYDTAHTESAELRKEITKWGYDKKRVEGEKKQAAWMAPVRSREDLVRELYRQMRGAKDKHDLFIEKWMQKQRERAEEAKNRALERATKLREKLQTPVSMDGEDSRRATTEEIAALVSAPVSHVGKYMSAYEGLDKDDRFLRKIGARVIGD